ncbi:PREDICTED: uncharacterized protein LOC104812624 [Tarenaya hassleriana]|uniref:uncharacterized protein LOC104812624 n=1 Tax=Tarenaya hassleriana TaxID=28532 RepID=UPI00053C8BEC|nr:PREDICTED: uncharacterized protein LOC104812624 [Tarenaya hassleriana]
MSEKNQNPKDAKTPQDHLPPPSKKPIPEISNGSSYSGQRISYPNPPDPMNPDPATLREQWRFAIRQYSRWYSQAWGTAILAGVTFFALGWIIKGSNPLPSLQSDPGSGSGSDSKSSSSDSPGRSEGK